MEYANQSTTNLTQAAYNPSLQPSAPVNPAMISSARRSN